MKLNFEQTEDDLIDLSTNSLRSSKILKYIGLGFLIFVLVISGWILMNNGVGLKAFVNWLYPIVLLIVFWYFFFKRILKRRLADPGNKNLMIGKRTVELLDEEIVIETSLSKTEVKWPAISQFKESKNSYFLFMGKSKALIFPKRIFKTDEEVNDFKKLVDSKMK